MDKRNGSGRKISHDFDVEQAMFRLGFFWGAITSAAWAWAFVTGAFALYFCAVILSAGVWLIGTRTR